MVYLSDDRAELLTGGFNIIVKPTIAVSTAVITALQGNSGTAIGVGVLGDAGALLAQGSGLDLSTYLANFAV
jgi:hypothetical protein